MARSEPGPAGPPANSVMSASSRRRDHALIAAGGTALWLLHALWLSMDSRPPVWDMAMHQSFALNYLPGYAVAPGTPFWEISSTYPPLVHLVIALVFLLLQPGPHTAVLANLPATFLLLWAVYELGCFLASPAAGRWACAIVLLTPYFMWMSRETILDYWLSAWVAAAWVLLLRTRGFESGAWSRVCGLACAAGLLTKWLFAAFMAAPVLLVALRHRIWRDASRMAHAADMLLLGGGVAAIWYLPNVPRLVPYFSENARIGALEGEPPVLSFQSLIYYLRLLEGYQLFAVLFLVTLAGIAVSLRRRLVKDPAFWLISIGCAWLVLTLLRTKDPRFTMPLLGPLAIAPGAWLATWGGSRRGRLARAGLLVLLGVQAFAINFGIRWLPREVVLLEGYQGSLRWDWNLYTQHYFEILGAPRIENWQQEEILARAQEDAMRRGAAPALALVPDLPRFSAANFLLYARLRGTPFRIDHLKAAAGSMQAFEGFDYVVMTERQQGMPWTTIGASGLNRYIVDEHRVFRLLGIYALPNGDAARLYFIDRRAAEAR